MKRALFVSLVVLAVACIACGDGIVSISADDLNRRLAIGVGQELRIDLGNVGPGVYGSPPEISSSALRFLDVDVIPPFTPAGPLQQFRFKGVSAGLAIIRFERPLPLNRGTMVVEDTVLVY